MTPAGLLLRNEIREHGPISFRRFMEVALYHPEHGYYRGGRGPGAPDPFGTGGDFYTAEQLQPVFGILIAAFVRMLWREMGCPAGFTVVELGAGRGEMAPFFREWDYVAVDVDRGQIPCRFTGLVFANEFFDALPVHAVVRRGGVCRERLVGCSDQGFHWVDGAPVSAAIQDYLDRYGGPAEDGDAVEVNLEASTVIDQITRRMERGYLLTIDYGYTTRELLRFPSGTLMSYRRHRAEEDVLSDAGQRDITAHVNFTALERHAAHQGWERIRLESLTQLLLRAGEPDQFAEALGDPAGDGATRRRLLLKTLLYGMGETFRALLLRAPRRQ